MTFSTHLEVNDLFDQLSHKLDSSKRLINVLIKEREECLSCNRNPLNESVKQLLREINEDFNENISKNRFKCSEIECKQSFEDNNQLKQHLKSHRKKSFQCFECLKSFSNSYRLKCHSMSSHRQEKRLVKCQWPGCGRLLSETTSLKRHALIHSGIKAFKCKFCGKAFRQKSNQTIHEISVHSKRKLPKIQEEKGEEEEEEDKERNGKQFGHNGSAFCCLICDQKFSSYALVKRHLVIHRNIKPFKCPEKSCLKSFSQKSNLYSHFIRIHEIRDEKSEENEEMIEENEEKKKKYFCSECSVGFSWKQSLRVHQKKCHKSIENNCFKCFYCDSSFENSVNFEKHLERHRKRYKCSFEGCLYSSALESHLRVHETHHSGKESYKCELCDKGFRFLGQLSSHKQKEHQIALPLVCEWPGCGNAYKTVVGLRKHKTIHTGETKYWCSWPECGQQFRLLNTLKTHITKHTLDKPFVCSECEKRFAEKRSLRDHERNVHKKE